MVGVRNADLSTFQSQSYVDSWLRNSFLPYYPATNITHITVGVEMVDSLDDATNLVVPAMRNVVSALKTANLQDRIKVSTPLSSAVLSPPYPPSEGVFSSSYDLATFVGLPGREPITFYDGNNGLSYNNIFYAQLDVLHFALAHRNFSRMKIIVTEIGWPTRGSPYASIDNAQTYNTNLIRHVMDGPGTPAWPHEELVVYIFSLFNENLKQGPETERNFGIFYPDMTSVYSLGFPDKGGRSWCIASSQALDSDLQYLLIWACILGKANCSAIQPGQQCFEPDTLFSHTSFAFNNYCQKNGATDDACNFGGTGIKVYTDPSYGKCIYHSCNTTTVAAATSFLNTV
ncbi:hypothetical protein GOBAR_DD19550 [Gossypium barbadense]|nr:hypothetical protein GOBAR_DD19550 [Gossypium barbadense]